MSRIAAVFAASLIAASSAARADPPFQVPRNLPVPGPRGPQGQHDAPIPHPHLSETFVLWCALGTSVLAPGKDVWHVRNDGTRPVPVGAHLSVQFGYVLHDDYVLDRAMAPGDGWEFISGHLRSYGYGVATDHDVCQAAARS